MPEQEGGDTVDQAQAALDSQQAGAPVVPQYVTMQQMQEMFTAQQQAIARQVGGVQGLVDKGLNAIRRDTARWAEENVGPLVRQATMGKLLESVPEEHRAWVAPVLEKAMAQGAQRPAEPPASPQAPQPSQTDNGWAQLLAEVQQDIVAMNINPADSGINYAALAQGDRAAFLKSLGDVAKKGAAAAAPQAQAPKAPAAPPGQRTVSPPVAPDMNKGGARLGSDEELMDAYSTGRINRAEFLDRMRKVNPALADGFSR